MAKLTTYLGRKASDLMGQPPYDRWTFERTVEDDLPREPIDYVCDDEGLSFNCDGDERIQSIFLNAGNLGYFELDLPSQSGRQDVLTGLGVPSCSGEPQRVQYLGDYGAWDRFDYENHSVHISYELHADRICMVTLMLSDVVPQGEYKRMQ